MTRSRIARGNLKRISGEPCLPLVVAPPRRVLLMSSLCCSENASEILEEYLISVGGREKILQERNLVIKGKKRGRPPSDASTTVGNNKKQRKNGVHPAESTPPVTSKNVEWKPPAGSWEDEISSLEACEDEDTGRLMVYLTWKTGHRTVHETSVVYKRCPQKVNIPRCFIS
jgi:chromobox protein 1